MGGRLASTSGVALLALVAAVAGGDVVRWREAPQAATRLPGSPPSTLDVLVLDRRGQPVQGLSPGDFEIRIDGQPRRVLSARPVARIQTRAPRPDDPDVLPARLVVTVVDEAGLARGAERPVTEAVSRLFNRLAAGERVALVRLPSSAGRLVLSRNGPDIVAEARAILGRAESASLAPPGLEATAGFDDEAEPVDERGNVGRPGAAPRTPPAIDRAAEIERLALRLRLASESVVPEVVRLVDSLKALPGPKTLVLFSTGIATDLATLRSLGLAAADAGATVHVVQLTPAPWQRSVLLTQPGEAPAESPQSDRSPALGLSGTAGLPALAAAGGGLFLAAEGRLEARVNRLIGQAAVAYRLEWESTAADRGARPVAPDVTLARTGDWKVVAPRFWRPRVDPEVPPSGPAPSASPLAAEPDRRPAAVSRDPELAALLTRVGTALRGYVRDLSSVVAEERYQQTTYRGTASDRRRVLRSDFLLLKAPDGEGWTPFRDVFEVDGRPVRDREERLNRLFLNRPDTALQEALRIKEESVRYLLGSGNTRSNVNWPTFALEFLLPGNQWRFAMSRRGEETVGDIRAWRIDYEEVATPTTILTYDRLNVPARGTFWIDPASARVVRTLMRTGGRPLEMTVTVSYRPSDSLGLLVPAEMREQFASRLSVLLDGRATYANFRRFQVTTAEEVKVPK